MSRRSELMDKCPFCDGPAERFPDPDGSCDLHCTVCTWHEHRPSDDEIVQATRDQKEDRGRRRDVSATEPLREQGDHGHG